MLLKVIIRYIKLKDKKENLLVLNLLSLFSGCGSSEVIKSDVEPAVDIIMNAEIFIADLLRTRFFFKSFSLCRCSIFICPTKLIENISK